ncbi:MAG: glycosyltransferase family 2 protein [Muribaculaceae bacterium]|nr:glycosyltransferase family 2 protein [Muribaculaceae bacterium]
MKAALVAVAYNRINSLRRLLRSLEEADYGDERVTLIISVDKSDSDEVERFATAYEWPHGPKRVKLHKRNMGLRAHILSQGEEEFDEFDTLVILEDDIIVSPAFFNFTRHAVEKYSGDPRIAGISLYSFPLNYLTGRPFAPMHRGHDVHFMHTAQSWGEVWMRDSWRRFHAWYKDNTDFGPDADVPASLFKWSRSWLKYHTRYCIETGCYFVYPNVAYSSNCGDAGTHTAGYNCYQTILQTRCALPLRLPDSVEEGVRYDAFFENEELYGALGLSREECVLDLNGYRGAVAGRRYCLSSLTLPYSSVRSFGLNRRPVETNILGNEPGDELHLYDTSVPAPAPQAAGVPGDILYSFRLPGMTAIVRKYGLRRFFTELLRAGVKALLRRK